MSESAIGLRFVAEGENEATAAVKRFTAAQKELTTSVLDGAGKVQNASSAWDRANTLYREGVISANGLRAAQTQIARQLAVLNGYVTANNSVNTQRALSELRAAQAARENARATEENARATQRAQEGYKRLRASIDPVFAAQQRLKQAHDTVREALARETITRQQAATTLRMYRQRLAEAGQVTLTTASATSMLRTQFLATANTIAILDGPLGGIASRFSAFGVLIGRTGLLLAGVAIAVTTLIAIAGRGTRQFAEFEVQAAKMNAVLETTRHASGLTGDAIERMSAQIALATLETEPGVRQAAMRLLSFRDIAGQAFEDVLKAAADMSALGFGTIESEAVKLAKALEDPAQALTSLSRAGIVFTRQQRAMIISMVESGDRMGAMDRILENVNRRVGGAAEAAARGTFAGSLDTIAQATGRVVREFGRFIVEGMGVGRVMGFIASQVEGIAIPIASAEQALLRIDAIQQRQRSALLPGLRSKELIEAVEGVLSDRMVAQIAQTRDLADAFQLATTSLRDHIRQQEVLSRLQQQEGQVERRREGIDNLRAEIDLREQLIGLTETEQRVRRAFAGEGLLNVDVTARVNEYRDALLAAGINWQFVQQLVAIHRQELNDLIADMARYAESLEREAAARDVIARRDSLAQENEHLVTQLNLMAQGVDETEARARAEVRVTEARIQQQLATQGLNARERTNLLQLQQNFRLNQLLNRLLEQRRAAARQAEDAQRATATGQTRLDELERENLVLQAIKDTGEDSVIVEALRNRQARDALDVFIAQNSIVGALATRLREALVTQQRLTAEARRASEMRREAQEREQALDSFNERLRLQREELALLDEGLSREQISRRLGEEAIRQEAERVGLLGEAAEAAVQLFRNLEAARSSADLTTELKGSLDNLLDQNETLEAQIRLLEQGVDFLLAQRLAEIEVQKARIRTQMITQGVTTELMTQLALLSIMASETERGVELINQVNAFRPAGGGGGGGRATDIQETIDQLTMQIERERQLLGLERQRRTELEIFFQLQDANKRADIQMSEAKLRLIAAEIAANREALEVEKERLDQMEQLADTMENSMERAFMSIVDGTKTASQAFKDMARQIIAELFRVLVVQQLVGQFREGGGGILGALAGGIGSRSANGNVFAGGNVVPFANGGVVTRPSLFPMSGGQTGLMGEAGPEAIMPLKRGRDGKLGVSAEGSGSVVQHFHFNLAANGDDSVKRIVAQAAPQIVEAAKAGVLDARRRGGQFRAVFGGGG